MMNLLRLLGHAKKLYTTPLFLREYRSNLEFFKGEVPDLLRSDDYEKSDGSGIYVPSNLFGVGIGSVSYRFKFTTLPPMRRVFLPDEEEVEQEDPPFEVNMMEALVGWKAFYVYGRKLNSASFSTKWTPGEPLVSECWCGGPSVFDPAAVRNRCKNSPQENGSCGIYAGDDRKEAEKYVRTDNKTGPAGSFFLAEIYGWGRYVRGDNGWRSQFAYPKCFYLRPSQVEFIDVLREFHVPIYVEQPIKVYSPEEDGYSGYRQNEENWDLGASTESSPTED